MELQESDTGEATAHVVEFRLGDEVCAIDIEGVDSIVEPKQVTRVPRAPEAVEGVMDLRGETTAIVDPREFLSVAGDDESDNILVLDRDDDKQKIGLRVAEVTAVSSYPETRVDAGDTLDRLGTAAVERDFVTGVIRKPVDDEDGEDDVDLALWVDVDRLVDAVAGDENGDNQH